MWPALSEALRIPVTLGAGAVEVAAAVLRPHDAVAAIVLGHGAGSRHDHPSMTALAESLASRGLASLRFDFPYVAAGRRLPGSAAEAVAAWRDAVAAASVLLTGLPVFAGGRSYGGRMATMADAEGAIDPAGIVLVAYPLHPPGRPERPRVEHLPAVRAPMLFVSGSTDPFVQPRADLVAAVASCRDATLVWVDGVGHSFAIERPVAPSTGSGTGGEPAASVVAEWIGARLRDRAVGG